MNLSLETPVGSLRIISFSHLARTAKRFYLENRWRSVTAISTPKYNHNYDGAFPSFEEGFYKKITFDLIKNVDVHEFMKNTEKTGDGKGVFVAYSIEGVFKQQMNLYCQNMNKTDTLVWLSPRMYLLCNFEDVVLAFTDDGRSALFIQSDNFRLVNARRTFDLSLYNSRRKFK